MTLFELFLKGGFVMWLILGCSLIALYIIVRQFLTLSRAKINGSKFILQIRSVLSKGDVSSALTLCSQSTTPLSNILRAGLLKMQNSHQEVKEAVESTARQEVFKLERGLGLLGSVAGVAPLLGFLGTVTGMIAAFRVIEINEGVVNPQLLAGGIWEALLTTAFGLMVGIPAYFMYNYFVNRVGHFVSETETSCNDFLDVALTEQRRIAASRQAQKARQASIPQASAPQAPGSKPPARSEGQ